VQARDGRRYVGTGKRPNIWKEDDDDYDEIKVNFTIQQVMESLWGSKSIALLFLWPRL
jgi:hypothetical protein